MSSPPIYRFDGVTLDGAAMQVCRGATTLELEPKSFRLLQFLIENRDRVLSKEEIFRVVWEDRAVSDNALTRAVAQIRKALDDDPRNPKYIDTVPTVGYRFIGQVEDGQPAVTVEIHPIRRFPRWAAAGMAAGVVMVAVAAVEMRHLETKPVPEVRMSAPIPLTTYRGSENAPSFSPDGNQVAFEWNGEKGDNYDIYVKTLGTDATPLRLTNNPAPDLYPSWSPDGRTIAFQRYISGQKTDLILIPALGGPERRLGEFKLPVDAVGFTIAWSLDSKWIVTAVGSGSGATLYRVSVETGEGTPLLAPQDSVNDVFPVLSPDGKTLLYAEHPPYNWGELWTVHVDSEMRATDAPRPLNAPHASFREAQWTPDGTGIIARMPAGTVRMPVEGSPDPQPFLSVGTYPRFMNVSRRGNRLAYSIVRGDSNIWRLDLTAKVPHAEPFIASTMRDVYPQYSPDGSKILFHTNRSGDAAQIWVADSDGKNARQLTLMPTEGSVTGTAHWSPDGETITFDSNSTGSYQIYRMSSDGGKAQQLSQGSYGNFDTSWSRDGKWLYYASRVTGRNETWKLPAAGGSAVQVTHSGSMMAIESPDGKTLYFCKETGSGSIWKMPVEGGPEVQLTDSLFRSNFAVTKQGIYYMTAPGADGISQIMFLSFTTNKRSLIQNIGIPEYGLDVSPDGRYLLYGQLDDPASDLMLVENFR